uniref:Reverse transcriptase domain-containing protein n=1 Tax=Strongyloides venezuelensis TaxID=75913 RepID=A0A0K0EW42_STRVS
MVVKSLFFQCIYCIVMNRICGVVRRAPPPGKGFKLGRSNTITRENAIITEIQAFDDLNDMLRIGNGVVGSCEARKYAESQRVAQIFQELSDKVSGVNVPTVKKRGSETGRFLRQEDLGERTVSPVRQSSDFKAKGCRFVGKVVGASVYNSKLSSLMKKGFRVTTQDVKEESLEKSGRDKPPRISKDSGDGAPKILLKAGWRKRKHDDGTSKPGDIPSNSQVRYDKKRAQNVSGSEYPQDDCPTITKRRKKVTFKDEIDVWYYGVKDRCKHRERNN